MITRIAVALICCFAVCGQTVTGNLQGTVKDPAGAVVAGAKIQMKGAATGIARSTVTNQEGVYLIPYLPPETYEVSIEHAGFQKQTVSAAIELNRTTVLNFDLNVAGTQQAVTVTDVAPVVDTTTGQIRRSVDENLVEAVPVGGRNMRNLFRLIPGFQINPTSGQDNYTLSSGSSASFNGTGTRGAVFQTDGIANDDNNENQNRQNVNLSTIKEFQVLTSSFSAEFGRGAGAVVLVQTKSGTNDYHGEAYWMLTNTALDARNYFQNAAGWRPDPVSGQPVPNVRVPSGKTHRPGGVFGGPIKPNKLFFFGSYERFWAPGEVTSTVSLLPKEYRTPRVDPQLPDAASRRAWVQGIIDRYPNVEPNNTVTNPNGYTATVARTNQNQDLSGRMDWNVSDRDIVYGRYQYGDVLIKNDEIVKGTNVKQDHRFQNLGLTWTHVFSPRWTGEGRVGYGRRRMLVDLVAGNDTPIVSYSGTNMPSGIGSASQYPLRRYQNDFQYVYNVSSQLGTRHNVRFGGDIRRYQLNDELQNYHRGFWTFAADGGFATLDNLMRGVVQTYQQGFGASYNGYRTTETMLYIQDSWKATRSLTLELGARFEGVGKVGEVNNLVDMGYGAARYLEPRFGFAWSPDAGNSTLKKLFGGAGVSVLRGGYGIYHGRIFQSIFSQIGVTARFNPPTGATLTFRDPNMSVVNPLGNYRFTPGPPASQVAITNADPNLGMPYTEQWNLTYERALPWNSGFSLSYLGNRGIGFIQYNYFNRAQFPVTSTVPSSYAGTANYPGVRFDKIDTDLFNTNPAPGFISIAQARINPRRPDGRYGGVFAIGNGAWSYYHGMQAVFQKRMSRGLTFQANYAWSKNIDTGSEATFVGSGDTNFLISETQGARGNRGLSRLDQPHRFVLSYSYEFPFLREQHGIVGRIVGGWSMNGITVFGAGNPVSSALGYDLNGDGVGGDRPFLLDPSVLYHSIDNARIDPSTGRQFAMAQIPVTAFGPTAAEASARRWPWYPGTGFVGSAGRNIMRTQGQNNFDVVFQKNFRLFGKEHPHHLQYRAEFYNLFNHIQFDLPNTTLVDTGVVGYRLNPNWGQISAQRNGARSMQMMLRYMF